MLAKFNIITRNFKLAKKMSGALDKIIANNKIAEETLAALKREFSSVKNEAVNRKIEIIQRENEELRKQVEIAKQQLVKLEIANGKKQISIPNSAQTSSPVITQVTQNSVNKQQEEGKKQPKKEKVETSKKEKATAEKPLPAVEVIDIGRLDMRVGKIIEAKRHPDAESLYLEQIDCGEAKTRTVVSGLVKFVPIEQMQNRLVVVLCNLKPAKMRGVESQAMVLCASTPDKVEILDPPQNSIPGDIVHCEGFSRNPDQPFMNPKKKIFEAIAPDLKVNNELTATYKGVSLFVEGKGSIKSQTLKDVNIK